ncbi:MAG: VWA containing CoxE family protein [Elainellaceae cyanobacterium]
MNSDQLEARITELFRRSRQPLDLGMREYLAALDAVQAESDMTDDDLKLTLRLLWCTSIARQIQFDLIWDSVAQQEPKPEIKERSQPSQHQASDVPKSLPPSRREAPVPVEAAQPKAAPPRLSSIDIRPPLITTGVDNLPELQTYWPISRRSMIYAWRYLRRPKPDGPPDVLDISSTVEQVAKTGVFLSPVYQRRTVNHARLLMLVDQGGSMMPFHRFSRDLIETAQDKSSLDRVDVYYFHNVPSTHLYQDPHLTQPIESEVVWALCDVGTSVLIVSDAGAARGCYSMERVRKTTEFLVELQQRALHNQGMN